jgi:hypothetical protein
MPKYKPGIQLISTITNSSLLVNTRRIIVCYVENMTSIEGYWDFSSRKTNKIVESGSYVTFDPSSNRNHSGSSYFYEMPNNFKVVRSTCLYRKPTNG